MPDSTSSGRPPRRRETALPATRRNQDRVIEAVFKQTMACIVLLDRDYRFVRVNEAYARHFGKCPDDFVGLPYPELCRTDPRFDAAILGMLDEATRTRRPAHVGERPLRCAGLSEGAVTYWNWRLEPILDEAGEVELLFCSSVDVTELKHTRAALCQSETSYKSVVATMAEGVVVQAADGRIVAANPAAERIQGRTAQEMLGRTSTDPMWEAVRADGSPLPAADHPSVVTLRTGEAQTDVVMGIRTPPGARRWISVNTQPVRGDGDAAPRAVVTTFHDITERWRNDAINASRLHLVQFAVTHTLDELLEETLNETEGLTGSLIGFYHFVDDDQDSLTLQNWSTRTKAQFCMAQGKGLHYPIAEAGVWVDCVRQRRGVVHNDYAALAHRKGMPEGHAPVARLLAVPVIRGERISAILGVGNKPVDYTDKDVEAVSLIADLAWEIANRKRVEEEQGRLNRELRAISNCNQTLMRAQDEQMLLDDICRIVCDEAGYRMAWVGYAQHDERKTVRPMSWAGAGHECLASARITWGDLESGRDPAGDAVRTGKLVCIQELAAVAPSGSWRVEALKRGYRSVVALPLLDGNDKAFGVLCIYSTRSNAYTPAEVRLLEELAGDLAFGVTVLRARIELKRAAQERLEHLRFLECMDRVSRTLQRTIDLEQAMSDALDAVLSIFDCDRAFLLTPCDPEAPSWSVPMERTKPEYPGAHAMRVVVPMDPEAAQVLRIVRATDAPVKFGPGTPHPLPHDVSERFGFKSYMAMAVYPKVGKPWQFGIHQCSHARIWTAAEEQLFAEVGRQISEALTSLLMYQDLCVREKEFRALAEHSPDVIVRYDRECRRTYVNPEFERVNGLSSREVLGIRPLERATTLAPVADTFTRRLKAVMETGVTSKIDLVWDKDGKHYCWYVRAVPERDSRGRVVGALTIWIDISEREEAAQTIRKLNADLSATLQAIPDLLFELDSEGTCHHIWARNAGLLGTQTERLLGHTAAEVLPTEAAQTVMASLAEADAKGSSFGWVIHLDLADGPRWFELSVSKKAGGDGQRSRFIVLSRDITGRKQAEDALHLLNRELEQRVAQRTAELERANAELEAFSYSVSHDLRAPLAAIDGFSSILVRRGEARGNPEDRHYLDRIRHNAAHMGSLIDDILDFSRTSRREMTMTRVSMAELAREVFEEARGAAPQRKIVLRLGELPPASGDRAMLRQVLVNLLSNAVKYTSPRAEARIELDGAAEGAINSYRVKDNGVGFDMQYADKLFGVFQRLHGSSEFEGTGIGLAIVKRIVVRHGGRVWAEAKLGEGATMYFTLPAG